MEQIERIMAMEQRLDRAVLAVQRLSAALDEYVKAQADIAELEAYYVSDEWKRDFEAQWPKDLKRGVLSEDAIWNLLEDCRDLNERMKELDHF